MSTETRTESLVTLTENAANQIKSMVARQKENEGKLLRIYVEGGGCSGLQYGLVFDEKRHGDAIVEFHGVSVAIDPESAEYLRGAVIDYADSLTNGGFKIDNPNAKHCCGCGKSFEP